jgi:hypothetical protein
MRIGPLAPRAYYQYRHHRAQRTVRGIDEQVAKAERAVAGALWEGRFPELRRAA